MRYAALSCFLVLSACKTDLSSRLSEANKERETQASAKLLEIKAEWHQALMKSLPKPGAAFVKGEHPMLAWRAMNAGEEWADRAQKLAEEYKDTPTKEPADNARQLMYESYRYWQGIPQEHVREDLPKDAPVPRDKAKPMNYARFLKEFIKLHPDDPFTSVAALDLGLMPLLHVYRNMDEVTYSPFYQILWDLPRDRVVMKQFDLETGEQLPSDVTDEDYETYRERLCRERMSTFCAKVPFEDRGRVMFKPFADAGIASLEKLSKSQDASLGPLFKRIQTDLLEKRDQVTIPEEYPIMADTISSYGASLYTWIELGPKGMQLVSDRPGGAENERQSWPIAEAKPAYDYDAGELANDVKKAMSKLKGLGASLDFTLAVDLRFAAEAPVGLVGAAWRGLVPLEVTDGGIVARWRHDGSLRAKRFVLNLAEKIPEAKPLKTALGDWTCEVWGNTPEPGTEARIPVERAVAFFYADGKRAAFDPGPPATPDLKVEAPKPVEHKDVASLKASVQGVTGPVLLGFHEDMTQTQMHEVLNGVVYQCKFAKDKDCTDKKVKPGLLFGVCR